MQSAKLFGTDGIRGEVGKYPLTQDAIFGLGRSLGLWLKEQHPQQKFPLKVLVGKDTRESGAELELALLKGINFEGLEALRVGICPTPTVAYLTKALRANLGIAISASHNPCSDNGIKFFDVDGYKLFPFAERRIEEIFLTLPGNKKDFDLKLDPSFKRNRKVYPLGLDPSLKRNRMVYPLGLEDLNEETKYARLYIDFAKRSLNGLDSLGLKIVLDCAFGSFSKIAPKVFQELGADLVVINSEPDGKNINVNCGTLYPQGMAKEITEHKADLGIAFDGDGDRVIVADEKGNILDGDHILAILGQYFLEQKRLASDSIICTQMSNMGLELCLKRQGIQMVRVKVGDKYVLQEMLKVKANLGGEQSGHIIILERTTTGDGLIVALELIKTMLETGRPLSKLSENLKKFPQVLVNVKVREKLPLEQISGLNEEVDRCRKELGENARLLVRYSGTENLARIMIEGPKLSLVNRVARSLANVMEVAVGEK